MLKKNFKRIDTKNSTCFYFDHIINIEGFDFDNILIDEKSYENGLVYKISFKTLNERKPLRIRFNNVHVFIRVYHGTRYCVLFDLEKYPVIFNRITYLTGVKSGITHVIYHKYERIKVDWYDSLPLGKTLTFHNDMILIKSVFNKDENNYYYNIFLQEGSYQIPKNNDNK